MPFGGLVVLGTLHRACSSVTAPLSDERRSRPTPSMPLAAVLAVVRARARAGVAPALHHLHEVRSRDAASWVGMAPVQLTVTPWWLMFSVWLTVTWMFLKSLYMNDSGLVGLADRAVGVRA